MNKKLLTILTIALTLSACGDAGLEEGADRNQESFYQYIVNGTLAFFKGEQSNQNSKESSSVPHEAVKPQKNPVPVQNNLSQMMTDQRFVQAPTDQKSEQEEIDQYRQDYAQAVDVDEKVEALTALVQADEENAVSLLKEAYASTEPELRKEAVLQMQDFIGRKEIVDLLLEALNDPDPDVVMEAVEALSNVEDKRVLDGLKKVAKSNPDELVREVAQDYADQADEESE